MGAGVKQPSDPPAWPQCLWVGSWPWLLDQTPASGLRLGQVLPAHPSTLWRGKHICLTITSASNEAITLKILQIHHRHQRWHRLKAPILRLKAVALLDQVANDQATNDDKQGLHDCVEKTIVAGLAREGLGVNVNQAI